MLCWTERGTLIRTRSLLLAMARVLIKIATPLSVEAVVKQIFPDVLAVSRIEEFRLDDRPQELLKGHTVIGEKAGHGGGSSQDDAEPACGLLADNRAKQKIHASGDGNSENRAKELSGRQTKEDVFLILPDLLRDLYFDDMYYLPFVRKFDRFL